MISNFEFADNVVGFMVRKEIDHQKAEEILSALKSRIKKVSPICLYLEDQGNEGISVGGFMKTLSFHFSHSKDLEKIAIVTNDRGLQKSMELKDLFVPARVQCFENEERIEAMNWVMQ